MVKIIAIDLDGTLFDKNKNISEENKKAVTYAKSKGVYVVICTGRPFNGVKPVLEQLNINSNDEYVICYNGAKVFNVGTGKLIYSSTITGSDVKDLYNESVRLNTCFHAFKKNEDLICNCDNPYTEVEKRINKLDAEIVDFNKIDSNEEYLKAMMVHEKNVLDDAEININPIYPEKFNMVRSASIFLEFLNKKTDKGLALKELAKYLNISMDKVMGIGDAGNDLSMIEKSGIGVCMINGYDYVKKVANYITEKDNNNSGVAEAIYKFVK
jgi:Cof subfamily protein (haloacid dehalogenase superfamily)